uniref:Uncharacterized protein n=1 Tax=Suricata suricatta TaxID=37032 RepID=A0A673SNT2_SURSU
GSGHDIAPFEEIWPGFLFCSNLHGLIQKHGLEYALLSFRQCAKDIGFIRLD